MPSSKFHPPHHSPPDLTARCRELFRLSSDVEPDLQQIARRAREIPVLAQRLIRKVNSVGIGLRNRVSEVERAVMLLGSDRIRSLVGQLLQETVRLQELSRKELAGPLSRGQGEAASFSGPADGLDSPVRSPDPVA